MARVISPIKDVNDTKAVWKVAVRITNAWVVSNSKQKQHVQMVVCDSKGDRAHIIAPTEFAYQFKNVLVENNTLTLENFELEKNEASIKTCDHPFKFILNATTLVEEVNQHKIPDPGFKFAKFDEIKNGKVRKDLLIDVIGAFHELGYTQLVTGGNRKVQINFKIKDLTGNILPCTLWDQFAEKFAKYNNERKDSGPVIIIMHNAMIKEATEKYELGISNAWNSTKLFINEDLPDIVAFQKSLPADDSSCSQSLSLNPHSQMLSQTSSFTQYSSQNQNLFTKDSIVMPLDEIIRLTEETTCVTTFQTKKIIPTKGGWYYKLCKDCPRAAKGDTLPIKCDKGHLTYAINLRFKLDVEVESRGTRYTVVFWDRECNQMVNMTAIDLHKKTIEENVTNPLSYPMDLDVIERRNLAARVKWVPLWHSLSVQAIKEDYAVIKEIDDQFPPDEETSKLSKEVTSTAVCTALLANAVDITKEDDIIIETQDLSATSEHNPEALALTPGKRIADDSLEVNNDSQDFIPTQLSSTKVKKINIKKEKK